MRRSALVVVIGAITVLAYQLTQLLDDRCVEFFPQGSDPRLRGIHPRQSDRRLHISARLGLPSRPECTSRNEFRAYCDCDDCLLRNTI